MEHEYHECSNNTKYGVVDAARIVIRCGHTAFPTLTNETDTARDNANDTHFLWVRGKTCLYFLLLKKFWCSEKLCVK